MIDMLLLQNKQIFDSLGGKPVDIKELQYLLSHKADKVETYNLLETKADKDNYLDNKHGIFGIHKQICKLE